MNWGIWIIVSFILFALFIGILSAICMREDVALVSKTYYQDELAYENQIQRINNTAELTEKPTVSINNHLLKIEFEQSYLPQQGTVRLFRPSDSKLDKLFTFQSLTNGNQTFDLASSPTGMYHVMIQWTSNGKDYYLDKIVKL